MVGSQFKLPNMMILQIRKLDLGYKTVVEIRSQVDSVYCSCMPGSRHPPPSDAAAAVTHGRIGPSSPHPKPGLSQSWVGGTGDLPRNPCSGSRAGMQLSLGFLKIPSLLPSFFHLNLGVSFLSFNVIYLVALGLSSSMQDLVP